MKILTAIFVVLALHGTIDLSAQSSKGIKGTWRVDLKKSIALMTSDQRKQFDSLDPDTQQKISDQISDQVFSFRPNNSFLIKSDGYKNKGTWAIESNSLVLTFENGGTTTQTIEKINARNITLRVVQDPQSQALFHRITLYSAK